MFDQDKRVNLASAAEAINLLYMWECLDQDEVGAKHIGNTKHFQPASYELIPPLASESGELIDLDDKLLEGPTIACLCGVHTIA